MYACPLSGTCASIRARGRCGQRQAPRCAPTQSGGGEVNLRRFPNMNGTITETNCTFLGGSSYPAIFQLSSVMLLSLRLINVVATGAVFLYLQSQPPPAWHQFRFGSKTLVYLLMDYS
ncbi:Hypothetical protein, putative [Bodo saltans]|uniref:Uncharacterized protein n=1 Tax=Bodo saltans TaxID=75058 RepID=A0A0S4J6G4_BODSA|nr:Hypothetical protein, putative [Bodo saltans]|eukprot:CUG84548.1 Hypothetical protein, putative [Bodo saltans]